VKNRMHSQQLVPLRHQEQHQQCTWRFGSSLSWCRVRELCGGRRSRSLRIHRHHLYLASSALHILVIRVFTQLVVVQ